jgi:hypothetical protein
VRCALTPSQSGFPRACPSLEIIINSKNYVSGLLCNTCLLGHWSGIINSKATIINTRKRSKSCDNSFQLDRNNSSGAGSLAGVTWHFVATAQSSPSAVTAGIYYSNSKRNDSPLMWPILHTTATDKQMFLHKLWPDVWGTVSPFQQPLAYTSSFLTFLQLRGPQSWDPRSNEESMIQFQISSDHVTCFALCLCRFESRWLVACLGRIRSVFFRSHGLSFSQYHRTCKITSLVRQRCQITYDSIDLSCLRLSLILFMLWPRHAILKLVSII